MLTWKSPPEESSDTEKKAKARLVVLGYTDPDLTGVARDAPTLAMRTRLMLFAICAAEKWVLHKGDIKAAFLQGDKAEVGREVYGSLPPELIARLSVGPEYIVQFQRAIYGCVHAPR